MDTSVPGSITTAPTTEQQLRSIPLEERSERELALSNILLQRQMVTKLNSINSVLQFFLWLTIVSILLSIVIYAMAESA